MSVVLLLLDFCMTLLLVVFSVVDLLSAFFLVYLFFAKQYSLGHTDVRTMKEATMHAVMERASYSLGELFEEDTRSNQIQPTAI